VLRAGAITAAGAAILLAYDGTADADTSPVGSFTTTIPVVVPAFHGIEPKISISYDSATGNGEVGVGWHLNVGSRITRRGALDGQPRYDGTDKFVMDGMPLVACAPHCLTGGTYETSQQSYERIVFDGTTWTRWLKSGVKMIYEARGELPGHEYQWSLARVIDTHRNTVTYRQDCTSGHCYPSTITYAASTVPCGGQGQPVCKTGAVIQFDYEARPDVVEYSTGAQTRQVSSRLKTIEVHMDGHLARAYTLGYELSPSTGNSVLHSVQQFGADATVAPDGSGKVTAGPTRPLPPTVFRWASAGSADAAWSTHSQPAQLAIANPPGNRDYPVESTWVSGNTFSKPDRANPAASPAYGDFDGDGRVDFAGWTRVGTCRTIYVRLAADPQGPLKSTPFPLPGCPPYGFPADLNGDGFDDLLLITKVGALTSAISNRDGTFTLAPNHVAPPWGKFERRCAPGDINGDHLTDLVCVYNPNGPLRIGVAQALPEGGFAMWDNPLPGAGVCAGQRGRRPAADHPQPSRGRGRPESRGR
jgi:hypothetical protein